MPVFVGTRRVPLLRRSLVVGASAPVNTVAPAITGLAVTGLTLACSTGAWTNSPTGYTYQWKRAGVNVGTNASTYTIPTGINGGTITCDVTATNVGGSTTQVSNTTAAVAYYTPLAETGVRAHYLFDTASNNIASGAIQDLLDLTGNGRTYSGGGTGEPTIVTYGSPSIEAASFDGSNDILKCATIAYNGTNGVLLAGAIKAAAGTAAQIIFGEASTSSGTPFITINDNGTGGLRVQIRPDAGSGSISPANVTVLTGLLDDTPHSFLLDINKATGFITGYLDGVAQTPVAFVPLTTTLDTSGIMGWGRLGTDSGFHNGNFRTLTFLPPGPDAGLIARLHDYHQRIAQTP